ncbi:MAG TPA: sigma 54-interacting transcriptional regulator [Polyangiaceae bacterium]
MAAAEATRTIHQGGSGWNWAQGYSVQVVEGPDKGKRVESGAERCSIGTHERNDLVLSDPMVSRFHCEFRVEPTQVRVLDLPSKNGTILDGVRIRDAYVKHGSIISIGRSSLRFDLGDGATRTAKFSAKCEFGGLVGESIVMRSMFSKLELAALSSETILLRGETGTGKGAAAEAIHDFSPRNKAQFVVVDCGAIPTNLLESELFGHERGAFTGAVSRRIGAFEEANGGTIFLDEIGELPLELQPKLLRALEERQIRRVGSSTVQKVDVRVIAATNRDLRKEVNDKRFRDDLYFRLAVIDIRVPALREHPEDIPLLIDRVLASSYNPSPAVVAQLRSLKSIESLQRASWPGNVRELRNHVHRCLVLEEIVPFGESAPVASVESAVGAGLDLPYHSARLRALMRWERDYLHGIWAKYGGDAVAAASAVGIARSYMYRLLSRHGIRRGS